MQVEDVVTVSTKGQVVIPRQVRKHFGIGKGNKLLVAVEGDDILLRRMDTINLEEVSRKASKIIRKRKLDTKALVDEAIRWARSSE